MRKFILHQERPAVVDLVARIIERDGIVREELLEKVEALQSGEADDPSHDPEHDKTIREKWQEIDWKIFWLRFSASYPSVMNLMPFCMLLWLVIIYQFVAHLVHLVGG